MYLLTPAYEKEFRKEKIARVLTSFLAMLILAAVTGFIFMLPSYFVSVFSKDDVLRQLKAEEEVFAKKEFKNLEEQMARVNSQIFAFERNEAKRHALSPLLQKLVLNTPPEIRIGSINFGRTSQERNIFSFGIQGEADSREDLLEYVKVLRSMEEFASVNSPVTNLLKENRASFFLDIKIKPERYKYAEE
ncbi:MAG: hypothetical protein A3B03_02685 [Candidatus Zambryskibacteria bacterium RIFCSPLOWO2_01_FULL_42_41]|nr:MAG: hypothetical protein A3B03_02685 [Candidatus Zambryskibacteria bacterium RIFCSPLOWO2_01_FULL_42_41]